MCTVTHVYCSHFPLHGTELLRRHPVAHRVWLKCPFQESISAVSWRTVSLSIPGTRHRDGMSSAAQADFGLYSDNICLSSLAWWCHLVLLRQLICNTALHGISVFAYEILGCVWMAQQYLDASLWPDGTCLNSIPPCTVGKVDSQRCLKFHLRQGEGRHEDGFRY